MKLEELLTHTFKALLPQIEPAARRKTDLTIPSTAMVDACRADQFDFFQPWIDCGRLTDGQMRHAAESYRLGKSKSRQPIYWLINDMVEPLDGLVGDTWVSSLLKRREPLLASWTVQHCLFGLHLLGLRDEENEKMRNQPSPVAIVEQPQSAVVLSELYPNQVWLSIMPGTYFTIDQLKPLAGRHVNVYPHTDTTLSNYVAWLEICDMASRTYHLDIAVSSALEKAATPDQKERGIDILAYIYENENIRHQTSDIKHQT